MNKFKVWFVSFILCGNLMNGQAQIKFFTCHEISVDEFHAWHEAFPQLVVLDIRPKTDYLDKHIPRAIWVSGDSDLISMSDTIDADQKVVIYDKYGDESIDACLLLASKGKHAVFQAKGGFDEWERLGYPVEKTRPLAK